MQSTSQRFHGTMHTWSGKGYTRIGVPFSALADLPPVVGMP